MTTKKHLGQIRKWQRHNPEKVKRTKEKFKNKYPEKIREQNRKDNRVYYLKNRVKFSKDPRRKLDHNVRCLIRDSLKGKKEGKQWEVLVGYTLQDLMNHLENRFDKNMSWDNYGSYWSIDHKKPISLFVYTNFEDKEFKQCWALNNLQPMEKIENIRKYNHFEELNNKETDK